jgi:hypothetical protein
LLGRFWGRWLRLIWRRDIEVCEGEMVVVVRCRQGQLMDGTKLMD